MLRSRQLKILLLLLAGFALAAAVLFCTRPKSSEEQDAVLYAADYNVGTVQALLLNNQAGTIALLNTAEGIIVDGADAGLYSQQKLKSLVYSAAHIQAAGTVSVSEGEDYGLAEPLAQIVLLLEDDTIRLRLGRQNPLSGQYYLSFEEGGEVFLVESETAEAFLQAADDLRDLSLYPELTRDTLNTLTEITLTNQAGSFRLELQPNGFYAMTAPVKTELNWERVSQQLLSPIRQLVPEHYVSDDRPLSNYGLDEPDCTLELVIAGKLYRCGFAQKDPETWYCADLDSLLVSEMSASAFPLESLDYLQIIGNTIYSKSIADLNRIGVKYNDEQYHVEISGEGSSLTATLGGRQLDSQQAVAFYRSLTSIPAADRFDPSAEVAPEPILTLTMSGKDGQEDILEFHPVSERQCAVYRNGVAAFTTYTKVVTDIISALDIFVP